MPTTYYVPSLIQAQLIAACKTSPLISLLNTSGTPAKAAVYAMDDLRNESAHDPQFDPCVYVGMPTQVSCESITMTMSNVTYECPIYVYAGEDDPATGDATFAQIRASLRVSIGSYYTASLSKLGLDYNSIEVVDVGWGHLGQDLCYQVKAVVPCLGVPHDGLISI